MKRFNTHAFVCAAMIAMSCVTPGAAAPETDETTRTAKSAAPSGLVDADFAIATWKLKPRSGETTSALRQRARTDLKRMMRQGPVEMKPNDDFYRLLAYLREYPWQRLPTKWQTWYLANMPNPRLTDEQRQAAAAKLAKQPVYKMTPKQVDLYLGYLHETTSSLRARVVTLARQNVGQPYDMYLLGEFPYEIHDDQPLFDLTHGDCVVFSEHTYAMALSRNWTEFFRNLMKIRYKNGEVGMLTRNHFTEADWDKNNTWLVEDMTSKLGATTVTKYTEKIDRSKFFERFGIGQGISVEMLHDDYIPAAAIESVLDKLEDGDFVNIVRGSGTGVWVGHVGLIAHGPAGKVHFIHSTDPKVVEVPLLDYVKDNVAKNVKRKRDGKAQFLGMKFLKLRADANQQNAPTDKP